MRARFVVVVALVALVWSAACEPPKPKPPPPPDPCAVIDPDSGLDKYSDGVCDTSCAKPDPDCCIIGDPKADAILQPVFRNADGSGFTDLHDGDQVPLILPPQGGKVILVGLRGTNVSCNLKLNSGVFDDCQSPPRIVGREGRPVVLASDGTPAEPTALNNYSNIPMCPSASISSSRDADNQPYRLEIRATEVKRPGEAAPRTHVIDLEITPYCAQPDILEDCQCECDKDFVTGVPRDQQCPTINNNDPPPKLCVAEGEGEGGEGEGEGGEGEGEGEGEGSGQ